MRTQVMSKAAYTAAHGELSVHSRLPSPETMEFWEKVKKLAVAEYLIIEPEKNENVYKLKAAWQTRIKKLSVKTNANFNPRFAINREEKHVVLWKEPKLAAVGKASAGGGRA